MIRAFIGIAGFLMPSELVWSMAASGLFKNLLGGSYVIVQPQIITLIGILFYFLMVGWQVRQGLFWVCIAFFSLGFNEYVVTYIGGGYSDYAFQQFAFGFLYPILIVFFLAVVDRERRLTFFRWFYIGYCVYLIAAIFILFAIDEKFYEQFNNYGLGGALISLRYQSENSFFSLILGNANKQSNYLIMSILLGPYLLGFNHDKSTYPNRDLLIFKIFVFLAIIILILLFSRAAIFLLPIAIYLNRRYLIRFSRRMLSLILIGFLVLIIKFIDIFSTLINYLLFSEYIDQSARGFYGTFSQRADQWREAIRLLSDPAIFLHGMGVGTYGVGGGGEPWSGTHNLFLDHWLASGVYGILVLTIIIVLGSVRSLIAREWGLFFGYIFFVMLSFREYSFSYLFVTSMGGVFFALLMFLTFNATKKGKLNG